MDFIFEFIIEMYMELMFLIVPENISKKRAKIDAIILAVVMIIIVFALFIWGVILLEEKNSSKGFIPICIAVAISLIQIIAGFILYKKKS